MIHTIAHYTVTDETKKLYDLIHDDMTEQFKYGCDCDRSVTIYFIQNYPLENVLHISKLFCDNIYVDESERSYTIHLCSNDMKYGLPNLVMNITDMDVIMYRDTFYPVDNIPDILLLSNRVSTDAVLKKLNHEVL